MGRRCPWLNGGVLALGWVEEWGGKDGGRGVYGGCYYI